MCYFPYSQLDLFQSSEVDRRIQLGTERLDSLFEQALQLTDKSPHYFVFLKGLKIVHEKPYISEVYDFLRVYHEDLINWLRLNRPTNFFYGTGQFTKLDHVLEAH